MAITISGENNNDRITAQDGVIDTISGFNIAGIITASSFTGDLTGDVTGNLTGNVTGNINNSTLLLQTGGTERLRITSDGKIGINVSDPDSDVEINRGSEGKYLTMGGDDANNGRGLSFTSSTGGTGSNGALHTINAKSGNGAIALATAGTERFRINSSGHVRIANTDLTASSSASDLIVGTTSGSRGLTIFSGTGNTGNIFFADTDTTGTGNRMGTITYDHSGNFMRFSTSGNQERLRIESGGDIGIGTDNPHKRLHVADYGTHGAIRVEASGNGNRSGIEFYRETSAGVSKGGAAIWVESDTSSSAGKLRFGTASNASVQSQGTDMILDNNGRLGIGSDLPHRALVVGNDADMSVIGSNAGIYLGTHPTGGFQNNAAIARAGANNYHIAGSVAGDLCIASESGQSMIFGVSPFAGGMDTFLHVSRLRNFNIYGTDYKLHTGSTERVRIDSSGKFGIGDFSSGTSVSQALHVKGSAPEIYLEHTGGYDLTLTTSDGMGMNGITVNGGFLSLAYNNKNIVMCRTGGNVGILSTAPDAPLTIYTAASQGWKFRINTSVSDGTGFYQRANGDFELVLRDALNNNNYVAGTSGGLQFATSGSERVRIASDGSVGIGITNPGYRLEIGNILTNNNIKIGSRVTGSNYGIAFGYYDNLGGEHGFGIDRKHGGTLTTNAFVLRADNGRVGINSTHPVASLDVEIAGTGNIAKFGSTDSSYEALFIKNNIAGYPAITNESSPDTIELRSAGSVQVSIDYNNNDTDKYFRVVANQQASSGTEIFRIQEDGSIGVKNTSPDARVDFAYDSGQNSHAFMQFRGPGNKSGEMLHKRVHNGYTGGGDVNLFEVTSWQSTNSRIFGVVKIMAVNPLSNSGYLAEGWFFKADDGHADVGTVTKVHDKAGSVGSLSWSSNTLRYTTPSTSYLDMHISVEYHAYDGATVVFDTDTRSL